jgi:hypothetical protein
MYYSVNLSFENRDCMSLLPAAFKYSCRSSQDSILVRMFALGGLLAESCPS